MNGALQNAHPPHCVNEEKFARLEERVKTIFNEQEKLEETLELINNTQVELLKEITHLNSMIHTIKWGVGMLIAIFGGVFVFVMAEIIKLI